MNGLNIVYVKLYFLFLGLFLAFWWPLSHWFYPDWYHRLLGFESYDYALVKIIGTIGIIPVLGVFYTALNPLRNVDFVKVLLVFFVLMAVTYIYLITMHGFPTGEYVNVGLLIINTVIITAIFPWRNVAANDRE